LRRQIYFANMKQLSTRAIALRIGLACAGIASAVFLVAAKGDTPNFWFKLFILFALTLLCGYLLSSFLIRDFISFRIRTLYKTLYNVKQQRDEPLNLPVTGDDLISQMQREVADWMKNRSSELEDLKKLETYRREFLGNVSHELKTPIFNIQGYITTLLDGGLEDEQINRNYLQRAEKSVERMIAIIDDLEAISRLESGELTLEPEEFDIADLMREVMDAQEMKAGSRSIALKFRENYKPVRVFADKQRIRQVLTNLTTNSIKYGKQDGQTEVRFYDMDDHVLVEVADNGIGIAREHLPRLFERFYRVDKGRSRDQGGTGLGLAIVKHILEAHGQTINVRSTEGVGSTFSFTLPRRAAKAV
jgi:two-component system, OmpR family, phosphate regulon sensor histidine kinase PhoR